MFEFLDCLRNAFNEAAEEKNFNCRLPWTESMKGVLNYSEETVETCKTKDDYLLVNDFGYDFSAYASAYNHSKCPGNLQVRSYLFFFVKNHD